MEFAVGLIIFGVLVSFFIGVLLWIHYKSGYTRRTSIKIPIEFVDREPEKEPVVNLFEIVLKQQKDILDRLPNTENKKSEQDKQQVINIHIKSLINDLNITAPTDQDLKELEEKVNEVLLRGIKSLEITCGPVQAPSTKIILEITA